MGTDCKFVGVLVLCAMISSAGSFPAASSTASIVGRNDAESGQTTSAGTERIRERFFELLERLLKRPYHAGPTQQERDEVMRLGAILYGNGGNVRRPPPAEQRTPVVDQVDSSDDDDGEVAAIGAKRASAAWDMDYGWGGGRFGKRRDRLGWAGRFGRSVSQQVVA